MTTTELTQHYLSTHPSIKDCLKKGIINYSKLARRIGKEINVSKKTSMEAILIACRRFEQKIKQEKTNEDKIISILNASELEIKNKILVAIIEKHFYPDSLLDLEKEIKKEKGIFYAIEGTQAITIVSSEKYLAEIKNRFKKDLIKSHTNLAMIILKSPKDLEGTIGVSAHLYSLFADHGINIIETMSCWTDTLIVISEEDISKALKFLRFA